MGAEKKKKLTKARRQPKKTWPKQPRKFNKDVVQNLESIFKIDWSVWEACAFAGISESAYYERRAKDSKFMEKMSKAKTYTFILAKKSVAKWVGDWDVKASIEFLKYRDKRWSNKTQNFNLNKPGKEISEEDEAILDEMFEKPEK